MGYAGKDNGFLRLTKFRAPKISLLAKFVTQNADGTVSMQGDSKVLYSSMMFIRTGIAGSAYYNLMKSVLIGIRYSIQRKQFKDIEGNEIPVMRYQMQQQKMYQQLCRALIMNAGFIQLIDNVKENSDRTLKGDFSLMKDTHIDLCTHKAFYSEWLIMGHIEIIRACGGHGYNVFSGLTNALMEDFPFIILEGENSVLFLQVAKDLLGQMRKVHEGKLDQVTEAFSYFKRFGEEFDLPTTRDDFYNPQKMLEAFKHACLNNTVKSGMVMM